MQYNNLFFSVAKLDGYREEVGRERDSETVDI